MIDNNNPVRRSREPTTVTIDSAKDLAALVAVVIALGTLVKGVLEYQRQGAQKRAELFFSLEKQFLENEKFREIFELLERDDPKLAILPFRDKLHYLGYYEHIALMLNSDLLNPVVAHYMYGYYALRCADSKNFWAGVERDSPYWSLFMDFAGQMRALENSFDRQKNWRLRF
jgi:hypothetical protein